MICNHNFFKKNSSKKLVFHCKEEVESENNRELYLSILYLYKTLLAIKAVPATYLIEKTPKTQLNQAETIFALNTVQDIISRILVLEESDFRVFVKKAGREYNDFARNLVISRIALKIEITIASLNQYYVVNFRIDVETDFLR
jgi:hypothetical protein